MKRRIYWLMFSLQLVLIACNKNDDEVKLADRNQALLGQWEYQAIMTDQAVDINGDGTANIDLFNTQEIKQCIKDNLTFFNEMGAIRSYSINENGLACDANDPYSTIEEDTYELIDNSIIRFAARNDMRILELTKTKLIIETEEDLDGSNVLVSITYKKG